MRLGGFAGDPVAITEERALVVFDGSRETIVMRFTLPSGARPGDSAWIMPVPARPSVELADGAVFGRIDDATGPERVTEERYHLGFEPSDDDETAGRGPIGTGAPAGGAPADSVEVLERRRLGSYEISTLAADDRGALLDWLEDNCYELPPDLAGGVDFYIGKGWIFTAAKVVAPAGADGPAALEPISVSFAAREPVYPVYLTRASERPVGLRLDIVAPSRVDLAGLGPVTREPDREIEEGAPSFVADAPVPQPGRGMLMSYSGDVPAGLRPVAEGQPHLTSYRATLEPSAITDDPRLTVSGDRERFRPKLVTVDDVYLGEYIATGVVLVLGGGALAFVLLRRRRGRRAA